MTDALESIRKGRSGRLTHYPSISREELRETTRNFRIDVSPEILTNHEARFGRVIAKKTSSLLT
jgi:hypothetical protein